MTVIFRALLVVGVLTYFAAQKHEGGPTTAASDLPSRIEPTSLSAAWNSLPGVAREQLARKGAAELARRFAAAKPSQDTLGSGDRRPAWRGALE